jgi:hypothetical protein
MSKVSLLPRSRHPRVRISRSGSHWGEALEAWAHSLPHKGWWTDYLRDRGGTSFWHETYFRRGGIEGAFVDVADGTLGLNRFAPMVRSDGPMLSARLRLEQDRRSAAG